MRLKEDTKNATAEQIVDISAIKAQEYRMEVIYFEEREGAGKASIKTSSNKIYDTVLEGPDTYRSLDFDTTENDTSFTVSLTGDDISVDLITVRPVLYTE